MNRCRRRPDATPPGGARPIPREALGRSPTIVDANHYIVTIQRVVDGTDLDPNFTMPAHRLTVSPDGQLNIHGQYQSRSFSSGAWDGFEVKRIAANAFSESS